MQCCRRVSERDPFLDLHTLKYIKKRIKNLQFCTFSVFQSTALVPSGTSSEAHKPPQALEVNFWFSIKTRSDVLKPCNTFGRLINWKIDKAILGPPKALKWFKMSLQFSHKTRSDLLKPLKCPRRGSQHSLENRSAHLWKLQVRTNLSQFRHWANFVDS